MSITKRAVLLSAAALGAAGLAGAEGEGFDGDWRGVLSVGSITLRLRLVVAGDAATLYSLDQGNAEIPASAVVIDGDQISATFPSIGARYEGRRAGETIEGVFTQGASAPLTFTRGAAAAPAPRAALTAEGLEALRAHAGAPAMAAAARGPDGRALDLAVGVRAVGRSEAVSTEDKWHIGSITKSMTATLVALAVEAGEVRWEDEVGDVLGPEAAASAHSKATFLHLLSHRAGLQGNLPTLAIYRRENPAPMEERAAYARAALAQSPAGPMEETFLYSNNGFIVAGAMLEARLGQSWEELIRTRLFAPLGMNSAGFGAPETGSAYTQPRGHAAGAGDALRAYPPGPSDNPVVLGPAGRVHCTLGDLLKFAAAHRDRASILSDESWTRLHTPPFGGQYALGLVRRGETLWHNGSNTLWYAEMIIDPTRGIVAASAANDGRTGAVAAPVGEALIGAVAALA